MSVLRKRLRTAVGILVLCGIIPAVFWYVAPYFTEDPMPRIMRQTPARIYYDCRGNIIYAERTYDCQWRFEIPLNELPPHVITTLLAVEDRKFYRHGGVNYMAGLRALFQNLAGGRIISGASTITCSSRQWRNRTGNGLFRANSCRYCGHGSWNVSTPRKES